MKTTWFLAMIALSLAAGAQNTVQLPPGVRAVWDLAKARREASPTRERLCINGLWRWQPASGKQDRVPEGQWGYFKVPGSWPGITDYMQKDSQTVFAHPAWKSVRIDGVNAAWYQREVTIPAAWAGRRILVTAETLNSYAAVYVDGAQAGEMRFPGGAVDITKACKPGATHTLSMLVVSIPLKGVMMSFADTAGAKEVQGTVERRGLCGDVWLVGEPEGPRVGEVQVSTSVRKWEITLRTTPENLSTTADYTLKAVITDGGKVVKQIAGKSFTKTYLANSKAGLTASWHPDKLWDLITPGNQYQISVSLVDAGGKVVDTSLPVRFGFREFWIDGRDFYLNGTRIFLCAVPLNNPAIGAALSTYSAVRETLQRLKSFGINFVYAHNYGCEPGTHLSFEETLRACDDEGVLFALAQPHFGQYDWKAADASQTNGYAKHAAFYVQVAGSHPSVVFYSMSHNAASYLDDMNPDKIDGITDPRPDWAKNSIKGALMAEAIVNKMDPDRIVYHHSSGNLSAMYTMNFYVNLTPVQELSDWFIHWSTAGVKPLFLCEYGVPCTWDWTMYRGWYKGNREWGSADVPWEFCQAEWSAQFLGDNAYKISDWEKENLRWEAAKFRSGETWHRWDYPHEVSAAFEDRYPIFAEYATDNVRAFRSLGVSAFNFWEYGFYWKPRPGVNQGRKEFPVDWDNLQRPGISPDFLEAPFAWIDVAYDRADWIPTVAAKAVLRNNMPLLAYIGGKADAVTSKDHNFYPGETVHKQLVVINNSRKTVRGTCSWSLGLPQPVAGSNEIAVETGQQVRIPLDLPIAASAPPGRFEIAATVKFSTGETQTDTFLIDVLPRPLPVGAAGRIALFDPKGETAKLLAGLGVQCAPVDANADLSGFDTLIVGKGALTPEGSGPDISRVRDGLKVILFEQTQETLEKRFGFRLAEYGLRTVFRRVPDHPLLAGLSANNLQNWRGEATSLPPRLKYDLDKRNAPTVDWCGITVTRVYRIGCRGNVASVLIEKPARGNFLPIVDGGFSLQYSPLMEYREGKGMVLFCQMDVSGRTESDPAAETLARNIVRYVSTWKPDSSRKAIYAGDPLGKAHLDRAGFAPTAYNGGKLDADSVLVLGTGAGKQLAASAPAIADFVRAGGNVLSVGLDAEDAGTLLPAKVATTQAEHIATYFEPPVSGSPFAGVGPADVHNRDPHKFPLLSDGASPLGDGILARANSVIFDQLAPYTVTAAQGQIPTFEVSGEGAFEGGKCALIATGSTTERGIQFGQRVKIGPTVGGTYTFSAFVKAEGAPVQLHLEVERAGNPWDRAVKADSVTVAPGAWQEIHATFKVEKPFAEGWQAFIGCSQEGARFRADLFRLYEGDYVATQPGAGGPNLFTNPSVEAGTDPWYFQFTEMYNVRRTFRHASFVLARLLGNLGVSGATPLLDRFHSPVAAAEKRWLDGFYLDTPEEWDDPYRFFCW